MNFIRHAPLGLASTLAFIVSCTPAQTEPASGTTLPAEMTGTVKQAVTFDFDFDNGNIATELIIPTIVNESLKLAPSGGDASIILYTTALVTNGWFDAIAPYRPVVKGVYSNIPKRSASESANNRNKNIAMAYAALRTLSVTMPRGETVLAWRNMLTSIGLDPDDNSTDLTTAVGIGNVAGNAVVAARINDGMNVLGDAGGRKYNRRPYEDASLFEPTNSPYKIKDKSKWQPLIKTNDYGIFTIQTFVTPQWGRTRPYTHDNGNAFRVPTPRDSDYDDNRPGYVAQVNDILERSANLTDELKMTAELFNNKFIALGFSTLFLTQTRGLTLDQFVDLDFMFQIAAFDGGIAVWKEKIKYNTVRPWTAVRVVYGDRKVRAWGGPGQGTVNDIRANEWEPYLSTADHSDYPSGSSCFCNAHAQVGRRYFGSENFGWPMTFPKGSSTVEPGVTPAADTTLTFATWGDFADKCAMSRVNAGVHFRAAVEEAAKLCKPMGDRAHDYVQRHLNGSD